MSVDGEEVGLPVSVEAPVQEEGNNTMEELRRDLHRLLQRFSSIQQDSSRAAVPTVNMGQVESPVLHFGRAAAPAVEEQTGSSGEFRDDFRIPWKPTKSRDPPVCGGKQRITLGEEALRTFRFFT